MIIQKKEKMLEKNKTKHLSVEVLRGLNKKIYR
jgi:hypothetical protein